MHSDEETKEEMALVCEPGPLKRNLEGDPTISEAGSTIVAVSFDGVWNFDIGYSPIVKGVHLSWSYNSFTSFIFDLLSRMEGTYKPGEIGEIGSYGRSFNR